MSKFILFCAHNRVNWAINLNNLQYKYKYEFCLTFAIGGTAYNYEEKKIQMT